MSERLFLPGSAGRIGGEVPKVQRAFEVARSAKSIAQPAEADETDGGVVSEDRESSQVDSSSMFGRVDVDANHVFLQWSFHVKVQIERNTKYTG